LRRALAWLISEFLAQKTGLKFTRVPYKSTANGDFAVASGEVLFVIPPASVVMHGGTSVGIKALATIEAETRLIRIEGVDLTKVKRDKYEIAV